MNVDEDLTECCICSELFSDPRVLPCMHTFCLKCLQQTATTNLLQPGDAMACPLCRREFAIPTDGMTGVKKNFFVEKLVDVLKISRPLVDPVFCEKCTQEGEEDTDGEIQPAVQYCVQCRQNICSLCCREHRKYAELKQHQLVQLGLKMNEDAIKNFAIRQCDQHASKPLEMYCTECRQVICMVCFAESHQLHKCSGIEKTASRFRLQIADHVDRMGFYADETSRKMAIISKLDSDFNKQIECAVKAIEDRGRELKSLVDKITESLLEDLASIEEKWKKRVGLETEEVERHRVIINRFKTYCTELNSKGSAGDICREVETLYSVASEIKLSHERRMKETIPRNGIAFVTADITDVVTKDKLFGRLDGNSVALCESEWRISQPLNVSASPVKEFEIPLGNVRMQVNGLTKLEDMVYLLCSSQKTIVAINSNQEPFNLERKIEINEIQHPWDLTSTSQPKCLYVTDKEAKCVWQITLKDNMVSKWLKDICDPFNISVSSDGHLMIPKRQPINQIAFYRSDSKLIRTVSLDEAIQNPFYVIQNANGRFFVLSQHIDRSWVLSHVSGDGRTIIESFNQKGKSQQLQLPCHLAIDPETQRLFLADFKADKVYVFDSLSFGRNKILLTKENNIINPIRLSYDPHKQQLIVGNWAGRLSIFNLI